VSSVTIVNMMPQFGSSITFGQTESRQRRRHMDIRIDGEIVRQMYREMKKQICRQMEKPIDKKTVRRTDRQTGRQADRQTG
jgi:hypothetical protein